MVYHRCLGQTGCSKLDTVRLCRAVAFEIDTECATAALGELEPFAYGEFDYLGYFYAIFAVGDIVDKLLENLGRFFHFAHTAFETCHRVAFGSNNFFEVEF